MVADMNFFDKLSAAIARNQSLLLVDSWSEPEMMPTRYCSKGDSESIIRGLWDWLHTKSPKHRFCLCLMLTLGFYQALGVQGLELLPANAKGHTHHIPIILDAKHSDQHQYYFARTIFQEWQVDAITLNPYAGQDQAVPFFYLPVKRCLSCAT